jgi:hypothetical protein
MWPGRRLTYLLERLCALGLSLSRLALWKPQERVDQLGVARLGLRYQAIYATRSRLASTAASPAGVTT